MAEVRSNDVVFMILAESTITNLSPEFIRLSTRLQMCFKQAVFRSRHVVFSYRDQANIVSAVAAIDNQPFKQAARQFIQSTNFGNSKHDPLGSVNLRGDGYTHIAVNMHLI
ncbi:hypothetical protein HOY80DRAFT_1021583 [Tuber brumale]|nr:hypothetical protein HOY80DRAFT_1021583 [Tuber brumale]